jgi:hypothetical protein
MPLKLTPKKVQARSRKQYESVSIDDVDVVLLQTVDHGSVSLQDIVFHMFSSESHRRRDETQWLAFYGTDMPHVSGRSAWIGVSRSVPLAVLDLIEAAMCLSYGRVDREMGRALHLKLQPFGRLSDDGLEILVPAALVGDPSKRRVVSRSGIEVIARGYTALPSKAAQLNQLFFG